MDPKQNSDESGDDQSSEPAFKIPKLMINTKNKKKLYVVLDNASIETVKVGKNFQLLNCEDHVTQMKRFNRDPTQCRPDIAHQCLLMLMDSPLNRAGFLEVLVRTVNNVLIAIHPRTRIPRTMKRFSGLMVQLLHKLTIRASDKPIKLLRTVKNPVTDHIPVGCRKLSTSCQAKTLVKPRDIVPIDEPIVVVIGAMSNGRLNVDYCAEEISISEYPLSAALTCAKICSAFEEVWGIH